MMKARIALAGRRVCAAAVVANLLGVEGPDTIAYATFGPLNTAIFIANADGTNERVLTRVLLRAGERVREQQHGDRNLRPVVLFMPGDTYPADSRSYPILLVAADDSKVPAPARGVASATDGQLPSNLVGPQILKPLLSRMWKQSQTFRLQCARIEAEPRLLVRVYTAATLSPSGRRAATRIHRGASHLEADVYLASRANDLTELIAHEFEHIIEQLDGVDLPRLARLAPATVWATADQRFETQRATQTGRLVAAEVEGQAQ